MTRRTSKRTELSERRKEVAHLHFEGNMQKKSGERFDVLLGTVLCTP